MNIELTLLFFKPFLCSFCSVLWLIFLLEHIFHCKCRCWADWNSLELNYLLIFGSTLVACDDNNFPVPSAEKCGLYVLCQHYALALNQMDQFQSQNLFSEVHKFSDMVVLKRDLFSNRCNICKELIILLRSAQILLFKASELCDLCDTFSVIAGLSDISLSIALEAKALRFP